MNTYIICWLDKKFDEHKTSVHTETLDNAKKMFMTVNGGKVIRISSIKLEKK